MNIYLFRRAVMLCCGALLTIMLGAPMHAVSAEKSKGPQIASFGNGKFSLTVESAWRKVKPKVRIIEAEFAVPKSKDDKNDGRVTMMGAGGSIEANVNRWFGQFTQPNGGVTSERAKLDKKTLAGQEVHLVDISGTYSDRRGPFAPAVQRPKYRMLAAIIATKKNGNYFVKLYGPARTVADNEAAFRQMINSLKVK